MNIWLLYKRHFVSCNCKVYVCVSRQSIDSIVWTMYMSSSSVALRLVKPLTWILHLFSFELVKGWNSLPRPALRHLICFWSRSSFFLFFRLISVRDKFSIAVVCLINELTGIFLCNRYAMLPARWAWSQSRTFSFAMDPRRPPCHHPLRPRHHFLSSNKT